MSEKKANDMSRIRSVAVEVMIGEAGFLHKVDSLTLDDAGRNTHSTRLPSLLLLMRTSPSLPPQTHFLPLRSRLIPGFSLSLVLRLTSYPCSPFSSHSFCLCSLPHSLDSLLNLAFPPKGSFLLLFLPSSHSRFTCPYPRISILISPTIFPSSPPQAHFYRYPPSFILIPPAFIPS